MKLKGSLAQDYTRDQWEIYGDLLGQTFLDAVFWDESKLVANLESGFRYGITPKMFLLGQLTHFEKIFYRQARSYRWTEYRNYLQLFSQNATTLWLGYSLRSTSFRTGETVRFSEDDFEIRGRYVFNSRLYMEGTAATGSVNYRNFLAWRVENDALPVLSDVNQTDESSRGSVHLRYRGKVIVGMQVGFERVTSNSVIGEYDLTSYRIYLSGRRGKSDFYHVVIQRMDKHYEYPALQGVSGFRDPEERIQNRTYVQWEHLLPSGAMGFVQISLLKNETILNQRYYNKFIMELGAKYSL